MQPLTQLAEFVAAFPADELPPSTREMISRLMLDLIGATAAGFHSPLATAARSSALNAYGRGNICVWLTGQTSSIVGAAMANSAAASALDIDDGHRGAAGHAGAGVIPAVLAVAEAVGASNSEVLIATALGYDVALRVAACRPAASVDTYASGRWVNYGAAAVAARLLKLDTNQTAHALGIAGGEGPIVFTMPSPKFEGSTIKEGIPPAVVAGITAAYRAREGATGPLDLFDDETRFDQDILLRDLGTSWELENCYLKPYACCRYIHAAIDAISAMRRPGQAIKSLRIDTFPQAMKLANERQPANLEGAQYSFYFSCALAALFGADALQPIDPKWLKDERVLELARRVELAPAAEFSKSFPIGTPARVVIDQGKGPEETVVLHPLGDVANPLSKDQIVQKFKNITKILDADWQLRIISATLEFEKLGLASLIASLSPTASEEVADISATAVA
ncbi:MmgE/PrpD family protein [Mesorhizobium japonicum]|uniref:Mll6251 protein n=1 Tax=Mesorhizobium japonicum (strain LMG 29417 / CECT 9101 / MAFF 303099) TaxID=266835 RepID=Q989X0_RHILO|nr:MmgE/PrpD family protein [Mesorhizobium japonicum]BAB52574.1 mll6251 [Mesorhizobium japonicum MAFF 303099]